MTKHVTQLAGFLLLAAAPAFADDIEDRAVEVVKNLGGKVTRDENDPAHPIVGVNLVAAIRTTDSQLLDVAVLKDVATLKSLGSLNLAFRC